MRSPQEILQRAVAEARAALERRFLGMSAEEIRYTVEDIRAEVRATRAELLQQIAALRAEIERLTVTGGPAEGDEARTD